MVAAGQLRPHRRWRHMPADPNVPVKIFAALLASVQSMGEIAQPCSYCLTQGLKLIKLLIRSVPCVHASVFGRQQSAEAIGWT